MDAVEFLSSDVVDLPKTRVGDFPSFLDRLLRDYRTQIQRVTNRSLIDRAITNELRRVEPLSNALRDIIALAVRGERLAAYNRLDSALRDLGPHLRMLMPSGDMSTYIDPMYRFRASGAEAYHKGDLFHIPFYLRRIVSPMRYSVAGLPCLYLGGSTEVCWRELEEPDLAKIMVSRYRPVPRTNLRILNFGFRPRYLAGWVANCPDEFIGLSGGTPTVAAHVACWPLFAACAIRVPDRTSPDRPEYFVPQLMLEWITKTHQFHGIRYFSTHYAEYPDDPKTSMNYVFPARTNFGAGYCPELCGLFELSDPLSWADAKAAPARGVQRPRYKTRGVPNAALEAEFGRAEDGLLGMPVGPLSSFPDQLRTKIRALVHVRAYELWDSGPDGRDWEHWFQAKLELSIPDDVIV